MACFTVKPVYVCDHGGGTSANKRVCSLNGKRKSCLLFSFTIIKSLEYVETREVENISREILTEFIILMWSYFDLGASILYIFQNFLTHLLVSN